MEIKDESINIYYISQLISKIYYVIIGDTTDELSTLEPNIKENYRTQENNFI